MNCSRWFSPTLGFHLISGVLVFDCILLYFTVSGYWLFDSDTQINNQHLKDKVDYKFTLYTQVSFYIVAYIRDFN